MTKYADIERYIARMWLYLLGPQAVELGFSEAENERCIAERQNSNPLPGAGTVLTFRIDNYDNWRSQRMTVMAERLLGSCARSNVL